MLPVSVGLPPDNASSAVKSPVVMAPPVPTDINGTARSTPTQLTNAVLATGAPAAYAPETPQPPKSKLTALTSPISSSLLAVQYLAQTSKVNAEDLALFAPRPRSDTGKPVDEREAGGGGDDFLAKLRAARDGAPPSPPPPPTTPISKAPAALPVSTPPSGEAPRVVTAANPNNVLNTARADATGLPAAFSLQFSARLPPPVLSSGAPPGLAKSRSGGPAYQLANARNTGREPTVTAVL